MSIGNLEILSGMLLPALGPGSSCQPANLRRPTAAAVYVPKSWHEHASLSVQSYLQLSRYFAFFADSYEFQGLDRVSPHRVGIGGHPPSPKLRRDK
jgi:hypothetical protein